MNNLEEYKQELLKQFDVGLYTDTIDDAKQTGFNDGFDAAIALDLPVKFVKFLEGGKCESFSSFWQLKGEYNNWRPVEEFYKYWIENIYKP